MATRLEWDRLIDRRLKLRDLSVFFTLMQCESMAKAAAHLGVTQPAVSQVVANLEQLLGVKLFERSTNGVTPTEYAHALLEGWNAASDELKQAIRKIEFLADPTVGELNIGCPEVVSVLLPPVIHELTQAHPGIVIRSFDVSAPTLKLPQVRDRSLDLAIVRLAAPPSKLGTPDDLAVEVLLDDETIVVAGRDSPWARRRKMEIAELKDVPWILPPAETINSVVIRDAFLAAGVPGPKVNLVTYSVQLRLNLLADGPYVSVLPASMLRLYGRRLPVVALPIKLPVREWPMAMVTLKRRTMSPVAQLFIDHLRVLMRKLGNR